jgi:hypothetical protein
MSAEEATERIRQQIAIAKSGDDPIDAMQQSGSLPDGKSPEASVSPLSTNYWTKKFESVGANMEEYKKLKETCYSSDMDKAIDGMDDDGWTNTEKNQVAHGSTRMSDLCNVSTQGLLKLGIQFQSPTKREEIIKKTEQRVPPEVRERAWNRAKEAAPRYIKAIKEAQDKGVEPSFSYF